MTVREHGTLYQKFDGYELGYQRELVRDAYLYVGLRPRGRGSRRNTPLKSELLVTGIR